MLAPSYKSADELGISERQKQALISAMYALQRQEFTNFDMGGWSTCICGRAHAIDMEVKGLMTNVNLHPLFIPCPATMCGAHRTYGSITQAEAARAVRNFLVTGAPRWGEALHQEETPEPRKWTTTDGWVEINNSVPELV